MFWGSSLLILSLFIQESPQTVKLTEAPPPLPPLSTVETGLVIIDCEVDAAGKVGRIDMLQGNPPFVEPSLYAVRQWSFIRQKRSPASVSVSVTMLYRARTVLPDRPYTVHLPARDDSPAEAAPVPITIVDPGYPIRSAAEGTVILQMQIDSQGRVRHVDVIQDVPSLTGTAKTAVMRWKFQPAKQNGKAAAGITVAVVSFLRPILSH